MVFPYSHVTLAVLIALSLFCMSSANAQTARSLHQFSSTQEAANWQIVNDGVMGGRSSSQATITTDGKLRFTGNLSLENNGGFASVRSRPNGQLLGLAAGNSIVLRVKGDGRKYTFNLYTPERRTAFSYQMNFSTINGQWTEVRLPVSQFVAHSFGRPIPSMRLNLSQVQAIGILLGDKRPGPFQISVDWINVQ